VIDRDGLYERYGERSRFFSMGGTFSDLPPLCRKRHLSRGGKRNGLGTAITFVESRFLRAMEPLSYHPIPDT
jgi:hypothetical protein